MFIWTSSIFASVGEVSEPFYELAPSIAELWPYHASLATLGFLLLMWGMIVARKKEAGWLKRHRILGISGAVFAIAGAIAAAYMVSLASEDHFNVPHAYLGSLVIVLLLFTPALGLLQLKVAINVRRKIRRFHLLFGRAALLLMALNMLLGMLMVGPA